MTESRSRRRIEPSLSRIAPTSPFNVTVALTLAFAVLLALYLLTGFLPLLLLVVAVAVVGTDRLLRLHPQARFHGSTATLLYLFVPGLFALGAGLLLDQIESSTWRLLAAVPTALLLAVIANAEYLTVDPSAETYEPARFILLGAIYLTAFAIFAVVFTAGLPVLLGMALVAGTVFLLTIDILRELEGESAGLWLQSGAVAVVMAECRAALYFVSLADVLAGAFMLMVFYVMTGLVQNQASGRLDRQTWLTYGVVAALGLLIVLGTRLLAA